MEGHIQCCDSLNMPKYSYTYASYKHVISIKSCYAGELKVNVCFLNVYFFRHWGCFKAFLRNVSVRTALQHVNCMH